MLLLIYTSLMHTFNDINFDTEYNEIYNSSVHLGVPYKKKTIKIKSKPLQC